MTTGSHSHSRVEKRRPRSRSLVRDLSIKHKLMAVIMLTCVAALSISGVIFIAWEWNNLRRSMVRDLCSHAEILANNCRAAISFDDPADATDVLRSVEVIPSILAACVHTDDGALFAAYTRDGTTATMPPPGLAGNSHSFNDGFLTLTRPVIRHNQKIGTVCLKATLDAMHVRLKRSATVIAGVILLSSCAAGLVSARLQRLISAPILHLAGVAKWVSRKKHYGLRATYRSRDETGFLVQAFNEMLEQIQQRDAALVKANEQLEARVRARTVELTAANDKLTREIAFREKAEETLKQRTDRIISHQRALLKLAENTRTDLQAALEKTTEEAAKTLLVARVSVWFANEKSDELVCKDLYRHSPNVHESGQRFAGTDYPAYCRRLEKCRILPVDNALDDERTRELVDGYLRPLQITSLLNVPIRLHGKTLGLLCCEHVGPPRQWSLEEQDFAASIADLIALHTETGQRRRVERALAIANEHLADTVRELRRSNKELQSFAHVTAHDLKAPLRGIGTLADWIASDYADKLDDQGQEQLHLLKARVSRMNELIDSILHYAEIGRVSKCHTRIDLNELVSETIDQIAPPESIRITIHDELPVVVSERAHLVQVFQNLITNAVKHMHKPQGHLEIGCTEQDDFWKISVRDDGPGIEEKYFDKIFRMFQTLAPREESRGTGIGLAIVKKIVELHGGTVTVESVLGRGSTFSFTFPKQHKQPTEREGPHHYAPPELV